METRNAEVTRGLREKYGTNLYEDAISVFCISNTEYWNHRTWDRAIYEPYLKQSGIRDMRHYCLSIVEARQYAHARQYLEESVPSFMARVNLWLQSGAGSIDQARSDAIRNLLDPLDKRLQQNLETDSMTVSSLTKALNTLYLENIYQGASILPVSNPSCTGTSLIHACQVRNIASWSRAAQNEGAIWSRVSRCVK